MKKYSIHDGNKHLGDFSLEELTQIPLNQDFYVWFEGLDGWKPLKEVQELAALLPKRVPPPFVRLEMNQSVPPPFPNNEGTVTKQVMPSANYQNPNIRFGYELASWWQRVLGDLIMVIAYSLLFFVYIIIYPEDLESPDSGAILFSFLGFSILIGAVLYPYWSGNLGHKIMGLKIISAKNGKDLTHGGLGAARESSKLVLNPFIIPIIMLLWDKNRQNLYDKMVETYVVKNKKV